MTSQDDVRGEDTATPHHTKLRAMCPIMAILLSMLLVGSLIGSPAASRPRAATPTSEKAVPSGTWELQAIVYADGGEAIPANPANYTIAFYPGEQSIVYPDEQQEPVSSPDGRIDLQLDCNGGSADYLVDGNRLTITLVFATLVGCLPPTLGEEFASRLLAVTSYTLTGDQLEFFLKDGGRMRFARSGVGTPAATVIATGPARAVVPAECLIEPRPLAELDAMLDSDNEAPLSEQPAVVVPVPLGREAPRETAAAVTEAVLGYFSCRNAGDVPRAATFLTDAGARRILGGDAAASADRRTTLPSTPAVLSPQARTRLISLTDIALLAHGRAAAVALINDPRSLPHGRQAVLLIFLWEGDRWLIDDLISFSVPSRPTATPAAGMPPP